MASEIVSTSSFSLEDITSSKLSVLALLGCDFHGLLGFTILKKQGLLR